MERTYLRLTLKHGSNFFFLTKLKIEMGRKSSLLKEGQANGKVYS